MKDRQWDQRREDDEEPTNLLYPHGTPAKLPFAKLEKEQYPVQVQRDRTSTSYNLLKRE